MQPRSIFANDSGSSSANGSGSQKILSGTPTVGSTVPAMVANNPPVEDIVFAFSGTYTATAQTEISEDGGATWIGPMNMTPIGGGNAVTTTNAPGIFSISPGVATNARARCTSYSNGSMLVSLLPGIPPDLPSPPAQITLIPVSNAVIDLVWNPIPGALTYDVWRGTATGNETVLHAGQNTPTYHDTGLANNTEYFYQIKTNSAVGQSALSAEVFTFTLPRVPTSLAATGTAGNIGLTWTTPTGGATTYNVYRGLAAGAEYPIPIKTGLTSGAYTDTHVVFGTTYYYVVKAVNDIGGESLASNEVSASATGQAAPTSVAASQGALAAIITWVAAAGASTYNLYRGTSSGGEAVAPVATLLTGTTYTDSGLTLNTTYYYKMTALSSIGQSAMSNEASVSIILQPPPTTLAAVGDATTQGKINLTWVAGPGATTYNLYRGLTPDGEDTTPIATGITGTSTSDTTCDAGTTYYYKMKAIGPAGTSVYSNETSGLTLAAVPINLAAAGGTGSHVYVQWTPSTGAATYTLQYSADGTTSWTDLSAAQAAAFYDDATVHAHYRVKSINATGSSAYQANPGVAPGSPLPNALTWLRSVNGFTAGTWTDQSTGGHNATQATSGAQMALVTNQLNGKSVVRTVDDVRIMDLADIIPIAGSLTLVCLFKTSDETAHNNIFSADESDFGVNLSLGQTENLGFNLIGSGGTLTNTLGFAGAVGSPQTAWKLSVCITNLTPNPNFPGVGNSNYIYNSIAYMGNVLQNLAPAPQPLHPTQAKVSIGNIQGAATFGYIGDFAELMITSSQPTAAQMNALAGMVNATYALTVALFTKQVLFIGDSLTNGGKATAGGGSWAFLTAASAPSRYFINQGWPGAYTSDLIAAASTALYPYTSCGIDTTCTIMFGTNDVVAGKSGATIYADIQTLAAGLRANGNPKIVVCTMLPRDDGSYEVQRQALNDLLRADHSFADGFFDVETVPEIGAAGAANDLTYYDADKVHLNDTGHATFRTGIAPIISAVW